VRVPSVCGMPSRGSQIGVVAAVVAVAVLGLPWWESPVRTVPLDDLAAWHARTFLAAGAPAAVLALLTGVAVLASAAGPRLPAAVPVVALAVAGAASLGIGLGVLVEHGSGALGPCVTAAFGLAALVSPLVGARAGRTPASRAVGGGSVAVLPARQHDEPGGREACAA